MDINILRNKHVFHTTRNGYEFTFDSLRDGKLFFRIPKREGNGKYSLKSIAIDIILGKQPPHFKDCRSTVLRETRSLLGLA